MAKKQSKRQRDIKTKLMAAIAMLLVSSIMMVSSTYAWFTLSTAPEVTGINTAVGANGNLEMALLPADGQTTTIDTNSQSVLSSSATIFERNETWGNLVDVSDTGYGLQNITLYPSQLHANYDANGNPTSFKSGGYLESPTYGADGRVSGFETVSSGDWDTQNNNFIPDEEDEYGVRAMGNASGMTDRQKSYRDAKGAAGDARKAAQDLARESLRINGSPLASIAVKKAAGSEDYNVEDLNKIQTMINDLNGTGGVLDKIEESYLKYILAYVASGAVPSDAAGDALWRTVKGMVEAEGAALNTVLDHDADGNLVKNNGNYSITIDGTALEMPAAVTAGIDAYLASVAAVQTAATNNQNLIAAAKDSYTWEEVSSVLTNLANPDTMKINGHTVAEVKADKNLIVSDVLAGKGITITIASSGGVYADVADQAGDYTANVTLRDVEFSGISLDGTPVDMVTDTQLPTAYLVALGNAVDTAKAPTTSADAANPMTDMFGYIIDLAFKTNAPDSNLLLQVEAKDRIYEGSSGAEITDANGNVIGSTMGHGATMTFKASTPAFSDKQVKDLMKAIEIVFFDPDTLNVIATARLDADNATFGADGWTAEMYIYTLTAETTTTYEPATTEQITDATTEIYTRSGEEGSYTYTKVEAKADAVTDGTVPYYVAKTTTGTVTETRSTDNKIMALTQNQAHKLSVLVYLDGNKVTNADVAATVSTSMTGTMNLQFSSSATLVPMNYTPLQNQTGNTEQTPENGGETPVDPDAG